MVTKIFIGGYNDKREDYPSDAYLIDTTSKSKTLSQFLSPMKLGPIVIPGNEFHTSENMENAWQYSKVYLEHLADGGPTKAWWKWAEAGWANPQAQRYPMGHGRKPVGAYYDGDLLNYYHSRMKIYVPAYATAVLAHELWPQFRTFVLTQKSVILADFDGYKTDAKWDEISKDLSRPMGHAFIVRELLLGSTLV